MQIVLTIIDVYWWIILASAVLSWFPIPRDNPLKRALSALTEPVYAPLRRVLNPSVTGGLDVSPIIVILLLSVLRSALKRAVL